MNITITVIGDTDSPDVQNLLAHLAKTTTATIVAAAEPAKTEEVKKTSKKMQPTPVVNLDVVPPSVDETPAVDETKPEETKVDPPKHSAEQVRAAAVKKSSSGKREEVKALIESFGTPNLAGLKPDQFDSFMEQLEKI